MYSSPNVSGIPFFKLFWPLPALLLILLGTSLAVSAQDTLTVQLDSIRVTGVATYIGSADAPLSLSTHFVGPEELSRSAGLSLSEQTRSLPGLWVNHRENYALGESMTIRGFGWRAAFGVRGIQVILDGIPLTVADGQSILNIVDPAFVRRIELIRGPASTYWGNSSGGVVYLSTEPNYSESPAFRVRTLTGSYGLLKTDVQYHQSFENHTVSTYASYLYEEGYRDYSTVKMGRAGIRGSVKLDDKSRLEYLSAFEYMPEAEHPSSLTAEQVESDPTQANPSFVASESGKEITQGQLGLNYYRSTPAGLLTLTGYGVLRDLRNPLPFAIITLDRLAGGFRGTLQKDIKNLSLNLGVESKYQHDDRTEYDNIDGATGSVQVDQVEKVWNQAAFFTARYHFGDFSLMNGLRFDRLVFNTDAGAPDQSGERTFYAWSPSISLGYQSGSSHFYSNISTSFEAPTTTELVNRPGGGNGFNPEIKPEKTIGIETGARGVVEPWRLTYNLAFYHMWIRDLLFPYQLDPNGPIYYRNQGETVHRGIEGSLSLQASSDLTFDVTYTLTDAVFQKATTLQNVSLEGNEVPGIPRHRLNTSVNWKATPIWLSLEATRVSEYPVNNLNSEYNQAYSVFDTKISYPVSLGPGSSVVRVHPFVNIKNIFDERYNGSIVVNAFGDRYYEPAAGRNWQIGVSVAF